LQTKSEDSVELCQVGIEQVQGVHNGRLLLRSSGRNRITEDSESSARWALSRCIQCTEGNRTAGSSEKILCQEGIETLCRQAQGEENSLSSVT
jgi:hypothetical protein